MINYEHSYYIFALSQAGDLAGKASFIQEEEREIVKKEGAEDDAGHN